MDRHERWRKPNMSLYLLSILNPTNPLISTLRNLKMDIKIPAKCGDFLFNPYFLTGNYLPPKTYDTPTRPPTSLPPAKPSAALTEVRPSANTLATPKAAADSPS